MAAGNIIHGLNLHSIIKTVFNTILIYLAKFRIPNTEIVEMIV